MKTQLLQETETSNLEKLITQHPFWAGLDPYFFHRIFECATYLPIGGDEFVFMEGDPADKFFLIHRGQIALETFVPGKGVIKIQVLGPGDALGWSWLFPPHYWKFNARTIEPSELVVFDSAVLREYAEGSRDFGHELHTRISQLLFQRLQATRQKLIEFYSPIE